MMLNQNVEIVLDDGNIIYVDFTVKDVDTFSQDVSLDSIRSDDGHILHIEDIEHVLFNVFERIDEYLKSTNQKTRISYKGVF